MKVKTNSSFQKKSGARKPSIKSRSSKSASSSLNIKPQSFALFTALLVGGTGLMGMISAVRRPTNDHTEEMKNFDGYGKIMGVVPTNTLFNWVRLGIGAAGLVASRNAKSAVIFNRMIAANYAGMAVMGMMPKTNTMFGYMPIYGANVALHGGIALAELFTEPAIARSAKSLAPDLGKLISQFSFQKIASTFSPRILNSKAVSDVKRAVASGAKTSPAATRSKSALALTSKTSNRSLNS